MRRLLMLLALPGLVAACGGGSDSDGGSSGAVSSSPCPSGAVVIHMKNIKFDPASASAKVGQQVCWINDDDVQHDAQAEKGADFKSDLFGKGKTFTATLSNAGAVEYVCSVHPGMTGTLDVKP
jgi:plastocyanin